jgi:hypothetical protein
VGRPKAGDVGASSSRLIMGTDPEITITKIEAARRQLRTAIELWFSDGDSVSTHALARAAYQVIHDLNRQQKGPELLFDSSLVKDEYQKAMRSRLTAPSNFMKHGGDRGKKTGMLSTISFDPDLTRGFILFAIYGLGHLQQDRAIEEIAFELWHGLHRPDLLSEAGQELLKNRFDAKAIDGLRELPKNELLKRVRDNRWKPW